MTTVRQHLNPGGTFAMYNYYEPFLLDRYAGTLDDVFGTAPCVELGDSLASRRQAVLTAGAGASVRCKTPWRRVDVSEPTDDYPFPYLQHRSIPGFYWHALLLMLAASVLLIGVAAGGSVRVFARMRSYVDLACMGAAFLLLETKNVVQFALLFGTTWFVNSLVFAGVLISVWLAVETARHVRLPRMPVLYLALASDTLPMYSVNRCCRSHPWRASSPRPRSRSRRSTSPTWSSRSASPRWPRPPWRSPRTSSGRSSAACSSTCRS